MFKSIHSKLTLLHAVTFGMLLISFALILYFSINSILGNTFDKIMLNAARSLEYSIFMPKGKKRAMDRIRDELLKSMSKEDVEFATRFMPKIEGFMKKVSIQDRLNHRVERVFFFKPVYVQIREIKQEEKGLPAVIARSESMENRTIPLSAETYASLLKGGVVFGVERWKRGERFRLVALLINDEDNRSFVLQLGMPSKEVRNMVRRLGFFNLVLVPVLLIIAAVGGYFFVRRA
ncbi:MAG: hypothetical protein GY757_08135, partial [bacterium]|nr:hypothetical protein [bacterium]